MTKFKIKYVDPESEEVVEVIKDFKATEDISAFEWAEDYAYHMADKGSYAIKEVLCQQSRKA